MTVLIPLLVTTLIVACFIYFKELISPPQIYKGEVYRYIIKKNGRVFPVDKLTADQIGKYRLRAFLLLALIPCFIALYYTVIGENSPWSGVLFLFFLALSFKGVSSFGIVKILEGEKCR